MTLEIVAERVAVLEKQMAMLMANNEEAEVPTKGKKEKKEKKVKSDDEEKPKKKRISGYILFSKAMREDVKTKLEEGSDEKVKSTVIMQELGKMWKALSDEEKEQWNAKATELKEADAEE